MSGGDGFFDTHGRQVHAFALQVANLGFERMTQELVAMLHSSAWRDFRDGLGRYRFLPGEFDYFLSQQGIRREHVMSGVRDVAVKAELETAMDERRTGEDGYRRPVLRVRAENPQRPGRPIEPFGVTKAEAKALVNGTGSTGPPHRPALGTRVRRYRNTGAETTKAPAEINPLAAVERLRRSAVRLSDDDLSGLVGSLRQEQRRRRRNGDALP